MPPQLENRDVIIFEVFNGMNTQSARQDLAEDEAAWMENLQPIGPNNLLTVPSPKAKLTTITGETILQEFFAPINGVDYLMCFCASGAAYQVRLSNGAQTKFANAGTFSTNPDMTIWNLQRILIADSQAGYCTWDGTLFVQYGGVSPNIQVTAGGSGYTSPTVTFTTSGSGIGATFSATQSGGIVTSVTLTNPGTGFKAGDTVTLTIHDGGPGTGATATAHVWPQMAGVTLAVFQGRVWIGGNLVINYTGTGATYGGVGYDDFLSADAAGSTTITDTDLIHGIFALRNLNNYLFIFGDNSVKQIGNISVVVPTVGNAFTAFTIVTLSSDEGTTYKNTIVSYNRLVLFANQVGVYAVFGTSVEKISDKMDGIFRLIDFTQSPSAAINDINNIKCFLLLVKYKDPVQGTRSLILTFMNKKWFVMSQGNSLSFIATVKTTLINETFATSGDDVTQIVEDTSGMISIKLSTSLTSHKQPYMAKRSYRYGIAQTTGADNNLQFLIESERNTITIGYNIVNFLQFINAGGQNINFVNNTGNPINFTGGGGFLYIAGNPSAELGSVSGTYLGMTIQGTVTQFSLNSLMLEYEATTAFTASNVTWDGQ